MEEAAAKGLKGEAATGWAAAVQAALVAAAVALAATVALEEA